MKRCASAVVLLSAALLCAFRLSYQQLSNEATFCLQNSAESAVRTFWLDVTRRCQQDPHKLMELYERVAGTSPAADKCSVLLQKQLRRSLLETSVAIFEDALLLGTFHNSFEVERLARRLFQCDRRVSQAVFERLVEEVYLFVDKAKLAAFLFQNKNYEQMVASILHFGWRFVSRADFDPRALSDLANYLRRIRLHAEFQSLSQGLKQRVEKVIGSLPESPRNVYFANVARLLNLEQSEFLYAPRRIGPDSTHRTPLTWIQKKNSSDSDSDLMLQVNDDGHVAVLSNYDDVLAPLFVQEDVRRPFFWLGQGSPASKWWLVEGYDDYVTLQNSVTQQLLCATIEYDENRRYVTLQEPKSQPDAHSNCQWKVLTSPF